MELPKKQKSNKYIHDRQNQRYRMNNLLQGMPKYIKDKIQYDDEAAWSFTNQQIAKNLCVRLLKLPGINPDSHITDATASVGGNTIAFAAYFAHVVAIELNGNRAQMLENNIKLLKLKNVIVFNDFAQNIVPTVQTDILFVDPPWVPHGMNYKDFAAGTLLINLLRPNGEDQPFEEFLLEMSQYTKYVVCKLPLNYNFDHLEKNTVSVYKIIDKIFHGRPNSSAVYIMQVV